MYVLTLDTVVLSVAKTSAEPSHYILYILTVNDYEWSAVSS